LGVFSVKYSFEYIKNEFEKKGWVLLSKKYFGGKEKLDCICSNGHHLQIRWNDFQQGTGCSDCSVKKKKDINFVRKKFLEKGLVLLSNDYINAHTKMEYICKEGHKDSTTWNQVRKGFGCYKCVSGPVSKISQEWLDSLGISEENREITLSDLNYKVDAFVPETNTVYEFFGDYWHGNPEKYSAAEKNFHNKKTFGELYEETKTRISRLEESGYKIIYIWENDFYLQNKAESS